MKFPQLLKPALGATTLGVALSAACVQAAPTDTTVAPVPAAAPESAAKKAPTVIAAAPADAAPTTAPMMNAEAPKMAGNPVFPGYYADPEGIVFDKKYWIYPTFSAGYDQQTHFDAFSSPDLVNWTKHPNILTVEDIGWAKRAMWAPSIISKDGKYYFLFGANDIQNSNEMGGIGIAVADKPEGPYKDHIGKPLIDRYYNGAQPIDQFIFRDKDDQYYIIYGGHGHCNIAKMSDDFKSIVPMVDGTKFREITPEGYVEGPFMFIRDGKYYFMWSEGGWTGPDYAVAYAVADSPFGPFKRVGRILQQDPTIARGAGHHSVIHTPGTDNYYIVYHRRPIDTNARDSRVTCIDKMEFDANGNILPVKMTNEGVAAMPIP